jgi:MarR family transcriptional regulator, organic hydroperoxide resistance regulator
MEVEKVGRVLGVLYRASLAHLSGLSGQFGISGLEGTFLLTLFDHEGITQERLSALLVIDKSATAKAMKSLEAKGLVRRTQSLEDRRAKNVFTTDRGKALWEPILANLNVFADRLASGVSPGDLETTIRTLTFLAGKLVDAPATPPGNPRP